MTDLSVVIPSFNTKDITKRCLDALIQNLSKNPRITAEIVVIDNDSTDGSKQMLEKYKDASSDRPVQFKLIFNEKNLGYSKANNQGIKNAQGKFILFLNSDAIVEDIDFGELFDYFKKHSEVAGLTVKVNLPTGQIDQASHRGFPTLWNSFCYFSGLEQVFGSVGGLNKIFGGYHLKHLDLDTTHEIDSGTGAFYFFRKDVLEKVGGFDDKNFFFYGEDLDLSYRIKQAGYKIVYYPKFIVLHLKYASGLSKQNTEIRKQAKNHFYEAMKIFYRKHYEKKHFWLLNKAVYLLIDIKKKIS